MCNINSSIAHIFTISTLYGSTVKEFEVQQNERTITGRVVSSYDGEGTPGVSVVIPGSSQGTVTDIDGNFSLNVPAGTSSLQFSHLLV